MLLENALPSARASTAFPCDHRVYGSILVKDAMMKETFDGGE